MIRHGRVAPRRLPRRAVQDSLGPTALRRPTLSSRVLIRAAAALYLALVLLVALAPVTTATSAAAFTYDLPANVRVDAQAFRAAETSPARLRGLWERSTARFVVADDASTTPSATGVATEAGSAVNVSTDGYSAEDPSAMGRLFG